MVQVLVILAFFAARLQDIFIRASNAPGEPTREVASPLPPATWWGPALPFLTLLVMWIAFHAFTRHAGTVIDRTGRLSPLNRAHALMTTVRITVLVVLFACVLWPGIAWADRVRAAVGDTILLDELIIVSPVLLVLVLTWWSIEPLERRVQDALFMRHAYDSAALYPPQSRASWVWSQVRHQVLLVLIPISLVLAWGEATDAIPLWFHTSPDAWWIEALHWLGIALVLFLTPLVLRFVWSTVQLGPGQLRDQVLATCHAYRVRVVGPLVWQTHGSLVNAAILGMFFPFRYLLLTDALLERLPREQLEVVLAHEVAHVRKRHMLWTAVAVFATVLSVGIAFELTFRLLPLLGIIETPISLAAAVASITLGFLVFGLVSRRFEWDADAFATAHIARMTNDTTITPAAVNATVATLQSVAELNAIHPDRFSYRHGSIAARQTRVANLLDKPVDRLPIARQVIFIKVASAVLLALTLTPLVLSLLFSTPDGGTP